MISGETLTLIQADATQDGDRRSAQPSFRAKLQSALQSRLVATISVSILLSLGLTGTSAWNVWRIYQGLQTTVAKQFKLQELSGSIIHLDEVLTMSARMAASTGDAKWETRYNEYVPKLEADIKAVLKDVPASQQSNPEQTDAANQKLVEMETKAFELVRQGKAPQALNLLLGQEYDAQKQVYSRGINGTLSTVKKDVEVQLSAYRQNLLWSVIFAAGSSILLALSWYVVLLAVKGYIRDRKASQAELLSSQENLIQVNQALEREAQERSRQEQQIREESDLLQLDVAHILDVVSALEEGDLTIEAEVNERATGLVSDTLNRLIESLTQIVSVVASTAQQVTQSADELQTLAVDTAEQAQAQTVSAQDVQALMNHVNALSDNSLQQAIATEDAVRLAQSAVMVGQQEMSTMVGGIDTLQQGTDQIVKRTELLTDFVDLAAQFSKDQKRVASLTRVLALNASTLSSRALKEQDPEQFASIANEFEAVARQVNDLASETNRSLISLQQRTDQIQTVTSGLNQDVSEISQLVQDFTHGVSQSRQAFNNIQSVTEQVAQVGQRVRESSQDIVEGVRQTLSATEAIASVAQSTEAKASVTRQQVEAMGNLARQLLERVEFFQVNVAIEHPERPQGASADSLTDILAGATVSHHLPTSFPQLAIAKSIA
ncbi:MAG: methyl-accepting chemotaxis protein [Thermosynechococcaceae cyanobacterium MS004]|nr:methyl-accepting chemotaxis protein [Thermosynechococcaceae cyanobacterium MS004]